MFGRKYIKLLQDWKQKPNRKPLILRGARQVGKTTIVNLFAKDFEQYIYLNLDELSDKKLFEENEDFEKLIDAIYFYKNASPEVTDTLIFIDEIQNSANAVSMLRYFYEKKPDLYIIAAGSLLESLIDVNISFPVGRVEYMVVHPLTFEEFLTASKEDNALDAYNTIPMPGYAYDKLSDLFKIYSLIGGMPEVVKVYLETKDFNRVKQVISSLITAYKDDVEKYTGKSNGRDIIRHIIENAFYYTCNRITFQGFGNSNYRSREVGESFRILEKAMLLRLVYPATQYCIPIIPDKKKKPRLHLLDTGLVNYVAGIEKEVYSEKNLLDAYKGKVAEHIVGQELIGLGTQPDHKINFWVRDKKQASAELDYLMKFENHLIPIEVKSGSSGKLKSLHMFMNNSQTDVATRFYSGKFSVESAQTISGKKFKLINLPLYLSGKIKEYVELSY